MREARRILCPRAVTAGAAVSLAVALALADADALAKDTEAVNDGILADASTTTDAAAGLLATAAVALTLMTVSFVSTARGTNAEATSADVLVAGAYHQRVVTPTGKVYVACWPRNSIVVLMGCGFHVVLALSSLYAHPTISVYPPNPAISGRTHQLSTTRL